MRNSAVTAPPDRFATERAVDEVLAESFPASDPPSWTPGIVRPDPVWRLASSRHRDEMNADPTDAAAAHTAAIDVSEPPNGKSTFVDAVMSVAVACGLALAVPFVVLLIGTPIALAVGAVVKAIGWLVAVFVS